MNHTEAIVSAQRKARVANAALQRSAVAQLLHVASSLRFEEPQAETVAALVNLLGDDNDQHDSRALVESVCSGKLAALGGVTAPNDSTVP